MCKFTLSEVLQSGSLGGSGWRILCLTLASKKEKGCGLLVGFRHAISWRRASGGDFAICSDSGKPLSGSRRES